MYMILTIPIASLNQRKSRSMQTNGRQRISLTSFVSISVGKNVDTGSDYFNMLAIKSAISHVYYDW